MQPSIAVNAPTTMSISDEQAAEMMAQLTNSQYRGSGGRQNKPTFFKNKRKRINKLAKVARRANRK